jgi:peptidoglycan/LPS O-acetylase OafA/YrhL
MVEAIFYIILCLLTGLCGAYRRMGFFGTFLIALFVTPVLVLLVLLLTGPSQRIEWHRRTQDS